MPFAEAAYANSVISTINVGATPTGIAYDPSNGYIYVAAGGTGGAGPQRIYAISGTQIVANFSVGCCVDNMAFDSSNGYIYATAREGFAAHASVLVISGTSVVANITNSALSFPDQIVYDPSNGYVYVTNPNTISTVAIIDGSSNSVVANVTVGAFAHGIVYNPTNGYVYVSNYGDGYVSVISGTKLIANMSYYNFNQPDQAAFDPANGYIYVVNHGGAGKYLSNDTVSVISGLSPIASVNVSTGPDGIAADPTNGYVFVTNFGGISSGPPGSISVIAGATVIATITDSRFNAPDGIAFDTSNGFFYVIDLSNLVYVINPSLIPVSSSTNISVSQSGTTTSSTSLIYSSEGSRSGTAPIWAFNGAYAVYSAFTTVSVSNNGCPLGYCTAGGTINQGTLNYTIHDVNVTAQTFEVTSTNTGAFASQPTTTSTTATFANPTPFYAVSPADLNVLNKGNVPPDLPATSVTTGVTLKVAGVTLSTDELSLASGNEWVDSSSGLIVQVTSTSSSNSNGGSQTATNTLQLTSTNIPIGNSGSIMSTTILYAGIVGAVIVVVALGAFIVLRTRRKPMKAVTPITRPAMVDLK